MSDPLLVHYEDLDVGQVISLGAVAVDQAAMDLFIERFAPGWDAAYGAPDAMVYALWSRLAAEKAAGWAQTKVLAVDGLRFMRNPPAGELVRGRLTVMGKDPVGDEKGIMIAQHDLLDEGGRLIFSCLTRAVFARR
ncbi:acyl dehydratase [Brevundimonas vitis]|uniref:Acyl dehydratase n=1 Tax=Brevundimonas vitisensis TaxID=2800818 RepID=A0ABX7BQJ2_9CAUL|nr:acyl dehydratase [Brevundimonas vitisensis]QQQ19864.1 acyl dehydratase [Brevundimonas vitisensis]